MEIFFRNEADEQMFMVERARKKAWGKLATQIERRLDDILAAPTLSHMRGLPGRCHELTGDREGLISIRVSGNYRLLFKPANEPAPVKSDGGLDWSGVTAITIVGIEDYHE